jgi:uncharacterized protein (TIGR03435 family)
MMRNAWFVLLVTAGCLSAQQFEVASVRLNTDCANNRGAGPGMSPGRLTLPCMRLRQLIRVAYGAFANGPNLSARLMDVEGGPAWLDTDQFDITAKAAGDVPVDRMLGPMLQALLEERFQVRVHKASKDMPIYALTVAKNGLKLQPMKEGSCSPIDVMKMDTRPEPGKPAPRYCGAGRTQGNNGALVSEGYGVTMAELAGRILSNFVDRPVIDRTGLAGRFDVHLEFARDNLAAGPVRLNGEAAAAPEPSDSGGLSIFTAVQEQLGLKLSADKGAVEVLVVDRAEKPSEN